MKTLCFLVSFLFCIFAKGQHIYFDLTLEEIDTVAKEDDIDNEVQELFQYLP